MKTSRDRPLLANSAAMIAQVKSDLLASRQTLRAFYEMNYVLVPDKQPRLTIPFFNYPDESDLDGGTFPERSLSDSTEHAGRRLAEGDRRPDPRTMAAGRERHRRRSPFDHRRAGHGFDLGNVARPPNDERLGGVERREVRSQLECAAAGGLDFRRRRVACRCFPRWCATTNASAAWSSTPCDWSWPRRGANTSIRRITTLPRFRPRSIDYPAMGQRFRLKSSFRHPGRPGRSRKRRSCARSRNTAQS